MEMNIDNINRLIDRIGKIDKPISFNWEQCYTGMAWEIEGKPGHYASLFNLGVWLGIDPARERKLQYLEGLSEGDGIEYFDALPLEEQKAVLVKGLESLRDTGEIVWR